jgi:hypothetical protein
MMCVFFQVVIVYKYIRQTRPSHSAHANTQGILNTQLFNFLNLIVIINIPQDIWIVYNKFINNYTLDECTHHCITHSVTAHPEDGQARSKYVGVTNSENIYNLCILLVFISKYCSIAAGSTSNSSPFCPQGVFMLSMDIIPYNYAAVVK